MNEKKHIKLGEAIARLRKLLPKGIQLEIATDRQTMFVGDKDSEVCISHDNPEKVGQWICVSAELLDREYQPD